MDVDSELKSFLLDRMELLIWFELLLFLVVLGLSRMRVSWLVE